LFAAHEAQTSQTQAEQRQGGGFGNLTRFGGNLECQSPLEGGKAGSRKIERTGRVASIIEQVKSGVRRRDASADGCGVSINPCRSD
jgi:hypothetical protein